jgi:hypothetical protein
VDFSEARDLFGIIFQILGASLQNQGLRVDIEKDEGHKCKVLEIRISRICFSKEKPAYQVHESVDRAGPIHCGPAAIAALGSSPELGLRPLQCPRAPTKGRGRGRMGRRVQRRGCRGLRGCGGASQRQRSLSSEGRR